MSWPEKCGSERWGAPRLSGPVDIDTFWGVASTIAVARDSHERQVPDNSLSRIRLMVSRGVRSIMLSQAVANL